jgi:BirA family biotin operon repressor/biotin-[acetyl-CoA-carboxylase] ligase
VNLYASVLLRPGIPRRAAPAFGLIAPLAVADALRDLGLRPALKWPNDVLLDRRKVAGARAEAIAPAGAPDADQVVLGVGVNLNVTREELRAGLPGPAGQFATSAREALGRPVDRNAFAATFLTYLDEWAAMHGARGAPAVLAAWRELEIVTGRRVEVRDGARTLEGRATGVDADGFLQVEDGQGRRHTVSAGEVRLLE